jgi:hypothetical protein
MTNELTFTTNSRFDIDEALHELLGKKDIKTIIQKNLKNKMAIFFKEECSYTLGSYKTR